MRPFGCYPQPVPLLDVTDVGSPRTVLAPDADLRTERNQLSDKKQQLGMRIANYLTAIGEGRSSDAIFGALAKAEAELKEVEAKMAAAEEQIARSTVQRPTAAQVQAVWGELLALVEKAPEEDKHLLLSRFIVRVEITGKNKASLRLRVATEGTHGPKFSSENNMGAGVGFEPTTFGL